MIRYENINRGSRKIDEVLEYFCSEEFHCHLQKKSEEKLIKLNICISFNLVEVAY